MFIISIHASKKLSRVEEEKNCAEEEHSGPFGARHDAFYEIAEMLPLVRETHKKLVLIEKLG